MLKRFRLAPMSPPILTLTLVLLALPAAFLVISLSGSHLLAVPGLILIATYAWVWMRFRPSWFVVHPQGLEVLWPLKRRKLPCGEITNARLVDRQMLRKEVGWAMRIGAGGLWGGFGWLWTKHRGLVQMYVSRTDGFVWIARRDGRPWLITPENPDIFIRTLLSCSIDAAAHSRSPGK